MNWLAKAPEDLRRFKRRVDEHRHLSLNDDFVLVCRRLLELVQDPQERKAKQLRHAIEGLDATRERRMRDHELPRALMQVMRSTDLATATTVAGTLHETLLQFYRHKTRRRA